MADLCAKRNPDNTLDDLASEFDYASEVERKKKKRTDFLEKEYPGEEPKPPREERNHWFQEEHGRMFRQMSRLNALDAYSRHKEMINLYHLSYPGSTDIMKRDTSNDKTDYDVLKSNHKFLWSEEDDAQTATSWEARMAKKYYDKLFKEYCIVDLTYFKKNKIAMRWRTAKEVASGKGQFICGNKKCDYRMDLTSWEVNFAYVENDERKSALVKVRLCLQCSEMLNYGSQKKKVEQRRKDWKKEKKSNRTVGEDNEEVKEEDTKSDQKAEAGTSASTSKVDPSSIWSAPIEAEITRTVDQDIDEFLSEMFM